jgi:hypothetical protein
MQGFVQTSGAIAMATPPGQPKATSMVLNGLDPDHPYPPTSDPNEYFAYYNHGTANQITSRRTLVVELPGSGSLCDRGRLMWVGQNLGFDAICVNYDNHTTQENICASSASLNTTTLVANCFTNISQAKLNFMGPCIAAYVSTCGADTYAMSGKMGGNYYVLNQYDSVFYRIATMLHYLWCNGFDTPNSNTYWEDYLLDNNAPITQGTPCPLATPYSTAFTPNWSSIILGGWSQGGDMSTFAASEYPVNRVVNLSAPPSADAVKVGTAYDMSPASYLAGFLNNTSELRKIYGLVSVNDFTHYCLEEEIAGSIPYSASVYASVWSAMGFTSANNDEEIDLNYNSGNPQPCTATTAPPTKTIEYIAPTNPFPFNTQPALSCSGTPSHNFVNWAPVNKPGGGHTDPLAIWNENIYEYMLID